MMTIKKEIELRDFEAWSGAVDTMNTLAELDNYVDYDVFEYLEAILEDVSGDSWDETSLNDFLWFENDCIAEYLNFNSWEELERKANGEDEIELKYSVGDIIEMTNGINAEIIEIDETDFDLPYYVMFLNENNETDFDWISEDEIEE